MERELFDFNSMSWIIKMYGYFEKRFEFENVSYILKSFTKKTGSYKRVVKIFPLFLACHEYLWVEFISANMLVLYE